MQALARQCRGVLVRSRQSGSLVRVVEPEVRHPCDCWGPFYFFFLPLMAFLGQVVVNYSFNPLQYMEIFL